MLNAIYPLVHCDVHSDEREKLEDRRTKAQGDAISSTGAPQVVAAFLLDEGKLFMTYSNHFLCQIDHRSLLMRTSCHCLSCFHQRRNWKVRTNRRRTDLGADIDLDVTCELEESLKGNFEL